MWIKVETPIDKITTLPEVGGLYKVVVDDWVYHGFTSNLNHALKLERGKLNKNKHACILLQRVFNKTPSAYLEYTLIDVPIKDIERKFNELLRSQLNNNKMLNYKDAAGNPLQLEVGHPGRVESSRLKLTKKSYTITESELREIATFDGTDFETIKREYLESGNTFKSEEKPAYELMLNEEHLQLYRSGILKNQPGVYYLRLGELFYIGSTNNLKNRLEKHFWFLYNKTHRNKRLQTAVNSAGYNQMSFDVIHHPEATERELLRLENIEICNNLHNWNLCNIKDPWHKRLPIKEDNPNYPLVVEMELLLNRGFRSESDKLVLAKYWNMTLEELNKEVNRMYLETVVNSVIKNAVLVEGVEYESVAEAAKAMGLTDDQLRYRLSLGNPNCRYVDTDRQERQRKINNNPVIFQGVSYNSISEASRATGISRPSIRRKLDLK